jgi:hypothetical protein
MLIYTVHTYIGLILFIHYWKKVFVSFYETNHIL